MTDRVHPLEAVVEAMVVALDRELTRAETGAGLERVRTYTRKPPRQDHPQGGACAATSS